MNGIILMFTILSLKYFGSCLRVEYCSDIKLAACVKYDPCRCNIEKQKLGCKLTCRELNGSVGLFDTGMSDHDIHSEGITIVDAEITSSHLLEINATFMRNFETVKVLNLSYNELNSIAPDTFHHLIDLELLDLSHNNLYTLSDDLLRNLTKLKVLNLAANQIQNIKTNFLSDLQMLIEFKISRNNIAQVPEDLFSLASRIKVLLLAYNELNALPDTIFSNLTDLEILDLSHNKLNSLQPLLFESTKNLHNLSISNNKIKTLDKETFAPVIKTINYIYLHGNPWICGELNYWVYLWLQEKPYIFESAKKLRCYDSKTLQNRTFYEDFEVNHVIRSIEGCDTCKICSCKHLYMPPVVIVDCTSRNLTLVPQDLPYRAKKIFLDNNKITSFIIEEESIHSWGNVSFLGLNNNLISSLQTLEGLSFLKNIVELNITGNKLTDIPLHFLEQLRGVITRLHLANNPWICNCNTIRFQVWLQDNYRKITDIEDIRCAKDDTYTSSKIIYSMKKSELCPQPSKPVGYLDILNITMGLLILLIISKVTYDYWHQKKTGKLPKFFGFNLP